MSQDSCQSDQNLKSATKESRHRRTERKVNYLLKKGIFYNRSFNSKKKKKTKIVCINQLNKGIKVSPKQPIYHCRVILPLSFQHIISFWSFVCLCLLQQLTPLEIGSMENFIFTDWDRAPRFLLTTFLSLQAGRLVVILV